MARSPTSGQKMSIISREIGASSARIRSLRSLRRVRLARNWKLALTGAQPRNVMYDAPVRGWIVVTITLCQVRVSSATPTTRPAQATISI